MKELGLNVMAFSTLITLIAIALSFLAVRKRKEYVQRVHTTTIAIAFGWLFTYVYILLS